MRTELAHVGARCVDSLQFANGGTPEQARALKAAGVDCYVGYLGAVTPARVKAVLAAGLAFMPVTFGGEYKDGAADEIAQLKALGIPAGATVWLDMEGLEAYNTDPAKLSAMIETWAAAITSAGWMAGLYVGVPQPLTSAQLYALKGITRYWRGQGRIVDHANALAEPTCGWCMTQMWPSVVAGGVLVDFNIVGHDYRDRAPVWVRAS